MKLWELNPKKSSVVALFVGILIFLCICVYWGKIDKYIENKKFYKYSGLCIPDESEILSKKHEIYFTDEYYSLKFKCSLKAINHILSINPSWATTEWKKGKKQFWHNPVKILGEQYSMISGKKCTSVFLTLVVDKNQNIVEFEYITF